MKIKKIKKYLPALIVLVVVLALGVYVIIKNLVSADTSAIQYPSWMDATVVQNAKTKWNAQQTSRLNSCVTGGRSTTLLTPTAEEKSLVGQNAKAFQLWTGVNDDSGTNYADTDFYMDKFRVAIAPSQFVFDSVNGTRYKVKFKYSITNPNNKPIYLKSTQLVFDSWGIPLIDPGAFTQTASQIASPATSETKLNPGEYVVFESPEFLLNDVTIYSTMLFATSIYDRNQDDTVNWGGGGSTSLACIADPFSYRALGGVEPKRPQFPDWLDNTTINGYNNTWTDSQKNQFKAHIYSNFNEKVAATSAEKTQFGNDVAVFKSSGLYSYVSSYPAWYQRKYKLAVSPLSVEPKDNGIYTVRLRLGIGNDTNQPMQIQDASMTVNLFKATDDPTVGNGYTRVTLAGTTPKTIQPGEYISVDSNYFNTPYPLYYYVSYAETMLRDDGSWDDGASEVFYTVDPIPLPQLLGVNLVEPSVTATSTTLPCGASPVAGITVLPCVTNTATTTASVTSTPHISDHSFPKGFSAFGSTKMQNKEVFSAAGLYLYRFDGVNNQWQYYPGNSSFDATAFYGYYVYNPSETKTLDIPYDLVVANLYKVTKGWNMLWSVNDKPKTDLQLEIDGKAKTANEWIAEGKLHDRIFIIENDKTSDPCVYFKLLGSSDTPASCQNGTQLLGSLSKIPAGKAFWVYVN